MLKICALLPRKFKGRVYCSKWFFLQRKWAACAPREFMSLCLYHTSVVLPGQLSFARRTQVAWPLRFCDTYDTFIYHISVVLGRTLLFPKFRLLRTMNTAQHFSRREERLPMVLDYFFSVDRSFTEVHRYCRRIVPAYNDIRSDF